MISWTRYTKNLMKRLLLTLLAAIALPISSVSSHGSRGNCSEECNDNYCPSEVIKDNIKHQEKNNSLKK